MSSGKTLLALGNITNCTMLESTASANCQNGELPTTELTPHTTTWKFASEDPRDHRNWSNVRTIT